MESLTYLHSTLIFEESQSQSLQPHALNPEVTESGSTMTVDQADPQTSSSLHQDKASSRRFYLCLLTATLLLWGSSAVALQRGDTGPGVLEVQTLLKNQGYFQGPTTGLYGSITESSVRRFQQDRGLVVDGIAGPATLQALRGALTATGGPAIVPATTQSNPGNLNLGQSRLRRGSRGAAVQQLQQRLTTLNYYRGPVTGVFGPQTEAAVKRFQQAHNLTADGIVGPKTLQVMQGSARVALAPSNSLPMGSDTGPVNSGSFVNSGSLRLGDRGNKVAQLQTGLQKTGFYKGPIDGVYSAQVVVAVQQFQLARQLQPDGIAGSKTQAALRNQTLATPVQSANPATNSISVLELQKRLKLRGFYKGDLDGKMGPKTESAIRAAQSSYGISASDVRKGQFK